MPTTPTCEASKGLPSPADFSHPPHCGLPRRIRSDNILCKQQPSSASIPINRQAAESNPPHLPFRKNSPEDRCPQWTRTQAGSSWRALHAWGSRVPRESPPHGFSPHPPGQAGDPSPRLPAPQLAHRPHCPPAEASCDRSTSPQSRGRSSGSHTTPRPTAQRSESLVHSCGSFLSSWVTWGKPQPFCEPPFLSCDVGMD